jgi:predicted transcriptional regulator
MRARNMTKAIIQIQTQAQFFQAARRGAAAMQRRKGGGDADFYLSYPSARDLYGDLTPARLDLLHTLSELGTSSVKGLAEAAGRNYSNVHADMARLGVLGLVEQTDAGTWRVPFDGVEIRVAMAQAA